MLTRVFTAVIGLPILIFLVNYGGLPLILICLALALIGQAEIYNAFSKKNIPIHVIGYVFTITYYLLILYWGIGYWLLIAITLFIITVQTCLVVFYKQLPLQECLITVFGFFYMPFLFSFVFLTRNHEWGQYYVWLIFTSSFACDTFAYFTGKAIGKHKLTNTPSPSKSMEGVIGGVIGAAVIGFLYGYFINQIDMMTTTVVSLCGAVFSVIGDMSASAIKRSTGIKDFGKLIPGHGGVMDRFDSVLITAPIVYMVMRIWI